jgi:hypothetical protein
MLTLHTLDTLVLTQEHGRHRRAEAAAERLRPPTETRRSLAAALRRAAHALDPAPLRRVPAGQS